MATTLAHTPDPTPHPRLGHVETILVDTRKIACDGGLGALGHPRVWLKIGGHQTVCPYCSRLFVLQPGASADSHGH
ncbi:zinc-finger domain-containing protein [Acetobacter peroxydans]|jgi:uncharacterized Zn-finger protein|uniref:zinc-finger domain-containing protein n=1 Tax=Acetobacter peroxydans TaxID=104098 RepID=UPI002354220C|nr:zinc-finger domain-containing protein [Acetobacter peroxydans]MCH4143011.1 zinc-finger domain-containing protein [Acetobacter peroxydans]MCI1395366.1 zinc-finger domain-containing protein [Acetobacter peroxydans]MCI1411546.1 zinc-finger domain-containing protein [Acetobacter peroxydans]MCI1440711.1 zinc-finger domain-containing protein [Acetobacter peroxydans]MCI1566723.1 zinc-finger domain-containing protein [Acetobacter peroxydans]